MMIRRCIYDWPSGILRRLDEWLSDRMKTVILRGEDEMSITVHQQLNEYVNEIVALSDDLNWTIGAAGHKLRAMGADLDAFAERLGMTRSSVEIRVGIYLLFGKQRQQFPNCTWYHFFAAQHWPDADQMLLWANTTEATVSEMQCYHRTVGKPVWKKAT